MNNSDAMEIDNQENEENEDICGCMLCKYENNKGDYKEEAFDELFSMLNEVSNPTLNFNYMDKCDKLIKHHNEKIYNANNNDSFQLDGTERRCYNLLTSEILYVHIYKKNKNMVSRINFQNENLNDLIENISYKNNILLKDENGVVFPDKRVLDGVFKLNRMRNDKKHK